MFRLFVNKNQYKAGQTFIVNILNLNRGLIQTNLFYKDLTHCSIVWKEDMLEKDLSSLTWFRNEPRCPFKELQFPRLSLETHWQRSPQWKR